MVIAYINYSSFFFFPVRMSWNIGDNRNFFLKPKSQLGLYHVLLTTPETAPKKDIPTLVEIQKMPDIEWIHSKKRKFPA